MNQIKAMLILSIVFIFPSFAARLSYQGVLEENGVPRSEPTHIEFALCSNSGCTGTENPLWVECWAENLGVCQAVGSQQAETREVGVEGGIFSVELGTWNNIPAEKVGQPDLYLRVTVAGVTLGDPVTHQYQHLVSVPYAMGSQGDFIVSKGSVGIGTQMPVARLEIAGGDIVARQDIHVDRDIYIDADTVDGKDASDFASSGHTHTVISNSLSVDGIVQSTSGGFQFPDGTVQTTVISCDWRGWFCGPGSGEWYKSCYFDTGEWGSGKFIDIYCSGNVVTQVTILSFGGN